MNTRFPRGWKTRGHTLVEVLVTIGLLVLVTGIVYGVIVQTQQVTRKSAAATMSQTQLVDAVTRITRDVAVSKQIITATPTTLGLETVDTSGTCRAVEYTVVDYDEDGEVDDLISRTVTGTNNVCPDWATDPLTMQWTLAGVPGVTEKLIVQNLNNPGDLFVFFDTSDQPMTFPIEDTSQIGRVQIEVGASITDSETPVVLSTSVAPRTGLNPDGTISTDLPPPAGVLDASGAKSCSSTLRVTWTAPIGATGYYVYRDGVKVYEITDPDTTYYDVTSVLPGATHEIWIRSVGDTGVSYNVGITEVTRCPAPPVASGVTYDGHSDGDVNDNKITWTASPGADQYLIYRNDALVATTSALAWVDTNQPWGYTDLYQVTAVNAGGQSLKSNTVTLTIRPAAPSVSGALSVNDVSLSWPAVYGAVDYLIYRDGVYYATTAATGWADWNVPWGYTHYYEVRARNAAGMSPLSNRLTYTVRPAAPSITVTLIAAHSDAVYNDIRVSWPAVYGATSYKVFSNSSDRGVVQWAVGNTTSFVDVNRPWGSNTAYQVVAYNAGGASSASNYAHRSLVPGPPGLSASHSNGDITLQWSAPWSATPITSYQLIRRHPTDMTWQVVYQGSATSWVDTTSIQDYRFDYGVRAYNGSSYGGGWGYYQFINVYPLPSKPTLYGSAADGSNNLSWSASSNATSYGLWRGGTGWIGSGGSTFRSVTDNAPGWGTTRSYQVAASNKRGSTVSNVVTLYQRPGPFAINGGGIRYWARYTDKNGAVWYDQLGGLYYSWSASSGASYYDAYVGGKLYSGANNTPYLRYPSSGYLAAYPGSRFQINVVSTAPNGLTRSTSLRYIMSPPAPPRYVWGATYCNIYYNNSGWKHGYRWYPYPRIGLASGARIDAYEFKFNQTNPVSSAGGYAYYTLRGRYWIPLYNGQQENLWGSTSNSVIIPNGAGVGGDMTAWLYRSEPNGYNYGTIYSMPLTSSGFKYGSSGVYCPSSNTTWKWNTMDAPVKVWAGFG